MQFEVRRYNNFNSVLVYTKVKGQRGNVEFPVNAIYVWLTLSYILRNLKIRTCRTKLFLIKCCPFQF